MRSRVFTDDTTSGSYRDAWLTGQHGEWDRTEMYTRSINRCEMHDVVTPSFSKVRNQGGIVCSPMYKENLYVNVRPTTLHIKGAYGSGLKVDRHKAHFELLDTSVARQLFPDHLAIDTLYKQFGAYTDLAVTRAHADVDVSEMQLLASLGELPETLSWLKSLITRLKDVVLAFKRRREIVNVLRKLSYAHAESGTRTSLKQLERYLTTLQKRKERRASRPATTIIDGAVNAWLEFRYAVRPLIGDIQNALNALNAVIASRRCVARGHEYASAKREDVDHFQMVDSGAPYMGITAKISEEETIRARGGVLYAIEEQVVSLITILGLDQPVESLWELIPFSFIIDWVFSIGDWLQSLFKSSGLDILTSWVSLIVERVRKVKVTDVWYSYNAGSDRFWLNSSEFGSSYMKVQWKWRYPHPAVPSLPRVDLKLNLAKIIDLGAIGRSLTADMGPEIKKVIRHA